MFDVQKREFLDIKFLVNCFERNLLRFFVSDVTRLVDMEQIRRRVEDFYGKIAENCVKYKRPLF